MLLRLTVSLLLACNFPASKTDAEIIRQDIALVSGDRLSVRSSTVFQNNDGIALLPQWAVDGSLSQHWANCFVSKNETSPWWSLDLGREVAVKSVAVLPLRLPSSGFPTDLTDLSRLDGLTVWIQAENFSRTACGSPWRSDGQKNNVPLIEFTCGDNYVGRYVEITVSNSRGVYLAMCEVFVNRNKDARAVVDWSVSHATAVLRPRSRRGSDGRLAIDGSSAYKKALCAVTRPESANPYIRVDLAGIYLVTEIRVLFYADGGNESIASIGSGAKGRDAVTCGEELVYKSPNDAAKKVFSFVCQLPQLADYVVVERKSETKVSLQICEIDVIHDPILNVYGNFSVSAWNQWLTPSMPRKAIDGGNGTKAEECFKSRDVTTKWWRLGFDHPLIVSVIKLLPGKEAPSGPDLNVFVGNLSTTASGKDNMRCIYSKKDNANWTVYVCPQNATPGLFVYVSGDNDLEAITVCEVEVYKSEYCEESSVAISFASADLTIRYDDEQRELVCRASGCPTPRISWSLPSGNSDGMVESIEDGFSASSTLTVSGREGGGSFLCTANNGRTFAISQIQVFVPAYIFTSPLGVRIRSNESTLLNCKAIGFPAPSVTWALPNGQNVSGVVMHREQTNGVTSVLSVNGSDGGGPYTCQTQNGVGDGHSATAIILVPPFGIEAPENVTLDFSEEAVVPCKALGYPAPILSWFGPDGRQQSTDRSGLLRVNGSDGGGVYMCQAGSNVSANIKTQTTVLVRTFILPMATEVTKEYGTEVQLNCTAFGYPLPKLAWKDPTRRTLRPQHINVTKTSATVVVTVSRPGQYTCLTQATAASEEVLWNVTVLEMVSILSNFPTALTVRENTFAPSVPCIITGYPLPELFEWQEVGNPRAVLRVSENVVPEIPNALEKTLLLGLVTMSQNKTDYQCLAKNEPSRIRRRIFTLHVEPDVITVAENPSNVYGLRGQDLSLTCAISWSSTEVIQWQRGSQVLSNKRVNLQRGEINASSDLILRNVSLHDGGNYYCTAGTRNNTRMITSKMATVGVIDSIGVSGGGSYFNGSNASVVCTVVAYPHPRLIMLRNGVRLADVRMTQSGGNGWTMKYDIQLVTFETSGNYSCAVHYNDTSTVWEAFDIVQMYPLVVSGLSSTEIHVNESFILSCTFSGFPLPVVTWTRRIANESEKWLSAIADESAAEVTSVITIDRAEIKNAGEYNCTASNGLNAAASSVASVNMSSIIVNLTDSQSVSWGGNLQLECSAFGYPSPFIVWKFRGREIASTSSSTATMTHSVLSLANLTAEENGGVYTCVVDQGEERKSLVISFPENVTLSPEFQTVAYGNILTLACKVSSYPAVAGAIAWFKDRLPLSDSSTTTMTTFSEAYNTSKSSIVVIRNVTEATGGNYSCLKSTFSPALVTIAAHFLIHPSARTVVENKNVSLYCKAVGLPAPRITWERSLDESEDSYELVQNAFVFDHTGEKETESTILLREAGRQSRGWYRCKAEAVGVYIVDSQPAFVDIQFPPVFVLWPSNLLFLDLHGNLTLKWHVEGNPPPQMTLCKAASPRLGKQKVSGSSDMVTVKGIVSELAMTSYDVSLGDSGHYWCEAKNGFGAMDSRKTRVVVVDPDRHGLLENITIGSRSMILSWSSQTDDSYPISLYSIIFRLTADRFYTFGSNITVHEARNFTLNALKPFSDYEISLVPWDTLGNSRDASSKFVKTLPAAPSKMLNFSVTVLSSTSLKLTWGAPAEPNGIISIYRVYYLPSTSRKKRDAESNFKDFPGNQTVAELANLRKFTPYKLIITAVNYLEGRPLESPSSDPVTVRTGEDAPSAPLDLVVQTVVNSSSTLRVSWKEPSEPNGQIRLYTVFYKPAEINGTFGNGSTEDTEFVIRGLTAFTTFEISVQAKTSLLGPSSDSAYGTTGQGVPSSPINLSYWNVTATSVALKWKPPERPQGFVTQYRICYKGFKVFTEGWTAQTEEKTSCLFVDAESGIVNNLLPDTVFRFTVSAWTVKGKGNDSSSVVILTSMDVPVQPILLPVKAMQLSNRYAIFNISLIQPSSLKGAIRFVQVLVASCLEECDISFKESNIGNYTKESTLYVAAQFTYDNLPRFFFLGDGHLYDGYWNAPLLAEMQYKYSLRSISVTQSGQVLYSTGRPIHVDSGALLSSKDCSYLPMIIGLVIGAVVVVASIIIMICCVNRKHSEKRVEHATSSSFTVYGSQGINTQITLETFNIPRVNPVDSNAEAIAVVGEKVILAVQVTGHPKPSVRWRVENRVLPGTDTRVEKLVDGSLHIRNVRLGDAGLYRCCVTNCAGTSFCHINLKVRKSCILLQDSLEENPIPASSFEDHVKNLHTYRNEKFSKEFSMLDRTEKFPSVTARLEKNRARNRYSNVFPYDHSRVVLKTTEEPTGCDYINASFLNGFEELLAYIAAQGPTDKTVEDFWRMIWQENVPTVVMLTNLEEAGTCKCVKYWPSDSEQYGEIVVSLNKETVLADNVTRVFSVCKPSESRDRRTLTHFHFTAWSDHGALSSPSSLVAFVKRARTFHNAYTDVGPMLVHCTAGVGRTGTFVVVDISMQKVEKHNEVDIFPLINELRRWRPGMVQTEAQYIFCHDAVLEYVLCGNTEMSPRRFWKAFMDMARENPETGKTKFEEEFSILQKVSAKKEHFTYQVARSRLNIVKNRYENHIASDQSRVRLSPLAHLPSYINAYKLPGYQKNYIATQGPLSNTRTDFWRMVWEHRCPVIVMLSRLLEKKEEVSALFWPVSHKVVFGDFTITLEKDTSHEDFVVRKLRIAHAKELSDHAITMFHYLNWSSGLCLSDVTSFLGMIENLPKTLQQPMVVMCSDGVSRSGTFCAICSVLERLKREHVVDVFQAVKMLRFHNPDVVSNLDHYTFCYKAVLEQLGPFDVYGTSVTV